MYKFGDNLCNDLRFESFVNSISSKTINLSVRVASKFESFVNSISSKTDKSLVDYNELFESFVNSISSKTHH